MTDVYFVTKSTHKYITQQWKKHLDKSLKRENGFKILSTEKLDCVHSLNEQLLSIRKHNNITADPTSVYQLYCFLVPKLLCVTAILQRVVNLQCFCIHRMKVVKWFYQPLSIREILSLDFLPYITQAKDFTFKHQKKHPESVLYHHI